jgi:hypothetical protein
MAALQLTTAMNAGNNSLTLFACSSSSVAAAGPKRVRLEPLLLETCEIGGPAARNV